MGILDNFVQPAHLQVKIACRPFRNITLDELHSLQGNLKTRTDADYAKFRNSVLTLGFSFPFFIWVHDNTIYTNDGHGRDLFLKRMRLEGVELPPDYPAYEVIAKDKKEAKKKLLVLNSQYGKITEEGLYEFTNEPGFEIEPDFSEFLNVPGFDFEKNDLSVKGHGPCQQCKDYHQNNHQ